VRSNERGEIGFLSDPRRMNVAMTRARRKLLIIGDSATLGFDPFYARHIAHFEAQGAYRSAGRGSDRLSCRIGTSPKR
jgi:superfamily I DNA and/or RNA helicase